MKASEPITLYLHVGFHKTGTTSIQLFLYEFRNELLKQGYLYPEDPCPKASEFGQHLIPFSLFSNKDWVPSNYDDPERRKDCIDYAKDIYAEASLKSCHTVILSSEEFDCVSDDEISYFCSCFSDFNIKLICFSRNTPEFLESAYKTSVVSGYRHRFEHFRENQRTRLDLSDYVGAWTRYVGKENFYLINYDNESVKRDVVSTFNSAVELDQDVFPNRSVDLQNRSYSAFSTEIVRCAWQTGADQNFIEKTKKRLLQDVDPKLRLQGLMGTFLDPEVFFELRDHYMKEWVAMKSSGVQTIGFDSSCAWSVIDNRKIVVRNLLTCTIALTCLIEGNSSV